MGTLWGPDLYGRLTGKAGQAAPPAGAPPSAGASPYGGAPPSAGDSPYGSNQPTLNYTESRSGAGHFSPTAISTTGPATESRSGAGHFGGAASPAWEQPNFSPYGSQSGPGILEQWFNERANGTDPAFEYAMKRGTDQLNNQFSAAGSFNSGAARQADSDLYANLVSQRMGQLDALAGGASGEHQGRLNSMFGQAEALARGQAGLGSAYDLGAAGNMGAANQAQQNMALNKAGVDSAANQGLFNNVLSLYGAYKSGGSNTNPYGGYDYGKV